MTRTTSITVTALFIVFVTVLLLACGQQATSPSDRPAETPAQTSPARQETIVVGIMPKLVGIDFFNACEKGALEAGQDLGVTVDFNGPPVADVQKQVEMLESWIAKKYDAVAVSANDPNAIAPALKKAEKRGAVPIAWDADAREDARTFFVNQCTGASVAKALMDLMAEGAGKDANYIIITSALTDANQNMWMDEMEKYRQEHYPDMTNLSETPKVSGSDQALATQVAADSIRAYPELDGVFAITSEALPGAAEAIRKADASERIFLTGLSTPNTMRSYIKDGTLKQFVLWNPIDLGYLTAQVAVGCVRGDLEPGDTSFAAGRLGEVNVVDDEVILGPPMVFDTSNIDDFDF